MNECYGFNYEGTLYPQYPQLWKGMDNETVVKTVKHLEQPGAVAHTYNPSILGARGRWIKKHPVESL